MYKKQTSFCELFSEREKSLCESKLADLARDLDVKRRDPSLSGHEEDLLGSFEVLVVLVGEQLVDMLLPIVIAGRGVFRVRRVAPLVAAAAGSGYYLVIL